MMADRSLLQPGGETWGPVSPDNVEKTGVWPIGQCGFPVGAAEAEKSSELKERPDHMPDPRFLCPSRLQTLEDLWSRRDDVTLGNPFGPFARGIEQVAETMNRAATYYRGGQAVGFDLIAKEVKRELAYLVEVERLSAKIGGREDRTRVSLRVTSIYRREDGAWRLVHRRRARLFAARGSADSSTNTRSLRGD